MVMDKQSIDKNKTGESGMVCLAKCITKKNEEFVCKTPEINYVDRWFRQ